MNDFHSNLKAILDKQRGMQTYSGLDLVAWVCTIIYLCWAEHEDNERSAIASFEEREYEPLLPSSMWFNNWLAMKPETLKDFIQKDFLPRFQNDNHTNPLWANLTRCFSTIDTKHFPDFICDQHWRSWLQKWVSELDFSNSESKLRSNKMIEAMLDLSVRKSGTSGGAFYTPAPIVTLMNELVDPKPGERVYDPCFGTGGLLVESARRIKEASKTCAAGEWEQIRNQSIFGVDIYSRVYPIALTRIVLAGIPGPGLELADSLERHEAGNGGHFDVVLACPPWGHIGRAGKEDSYRHFTVRSKDSANLFIQHIMQSLRPGGRAVVAVPEGTLFSAGSDRQLRRKLLDEYEVEGVISLPSGTFSPFTGIKSNLILFQKTKPGHSVRFCQVKQLAGTAGKVLREAEKPEEIAVRFRDGKKSDLLWDTEIEELKKRDCELIAKRTGEEDLQKWLSAVQKNSPSVQVTALEKVAEVVTGISYSKRIVRERSKTFVQSNLLGEEKKEIQRGLFNQQVGLLRVSDIRDGKAAAPELVLTDEALAKVNGPQRIRTNDLLITASGTIGKLALFTGDEKNLECVPAKSVILIRPSSGILPEYLFTLLKSEVYQKWFLGNARGATIQHLSVRTLRHMSIPVPELQIQDRIAREWKKNAADDPLALLLEFSSIKATKPAKAIHNALRITRENRQQIDKIETSNPIIALDKVALLFKELEKKWSKEFTQVLSLEWCGKFITNMSTAMSSLEGIQHVSAGPSVYALITDSMQWLQDAYESLPDPYKTVMEADEANLIDQFDNICQKITEFSGSAFERLLNNVVVEAVPDTGFVATGSAQEIQLRITNKSSLPLRNVDFYTQPEIGKTRISYLAETDKKSFPVKIPAQSLVGKYPFLLLWKGSKLNGDVAEGKIELAIEIRSTRESVHTEELGASPYITGSPIDRREMFFGRKDVTEKIKRQISTTHRANIILLEGNRRSGKTSILNYLTSMETLQGWIPVYCSFQGATGHLSKSGLPTEEVFNFIAKQIFKSVLKSGKRTWFPDMEMPDATGLAFEAAFMKTSNSVFKTDSSVENFELYLKSVLTTVAPQRLLLLLDEFDKIQDGIDSGVTSPQVPENLRYFLHNYSGLCAILSYSKFLRRLRQEYMSVLFGLGYPVTVGPLSKEDSRLLVTQPSEDRLSFVDEARDYIVELCAGQPFLIQTLCNHIFESAAETGQRTITVGMVNDNAVIMAGDNEHFTTLWQHHVGSERRKYILCLFEKLSNTPDSITLSLLDIKLEEAGVIMQKKQQLGDDLEHLRELDLVKMDDNGSEYHLAIPLMEIWIRQNIDVEHQRRLAVQEGQEELE